MLYFCLTLLNIQKLCANFCNTVNMGVKYRYLRSRSAHFHVSNNMEYFNSNHRVHAVHLFKSVETHTSSFILSLILPMRQPNTTTNSLLAVILLIHIYIYMYLYLYTLRNRALPKVVGRQHRYKRMNKGVGKSGIARLTHSDARLVQQQYITRL